MHDSVRTAATPRQEEGGGLTKCKECIMHQHVSFWFQVLVSWQTLLTRCQRGMRGQWQGK